MLPKIHIISEKTSNKSGSELNCVQKPPQAYMSIKRIDLWNSLAPLQAETRHMRYWNILYEIQF